MTGLAGRISRAPLAYDPALGRETLEAVDPGLRGGAFGDVLKGASGTSPYLRRLLTREAEWLTGAAVAAPEDTLDILISEVRTAGEDAPRQADLGTALRVAKRRAALLIALADLGGVWGLAEVTAALTRFADVTVTAASQWLLRAEIRQGKLPGLTETDLATGAGFIALAMGKMGAFELNYSSDIDLILLFDGQGFDGDDVLEARARYIHVSKQLVKVLSEVTGEGYVFRTDLRLRPSPSTTPVCMATEAAERYYESVGRTWERSAHIKARPLVDAEAGATYLASLSPFIWRRHLDFAALEDTQDMLRKIRAQKAQFTADALPGHDLKLGPGGIREIEFFAQTRQLIMGGRNENLRSPTTLGALDALTEAGVIETAVRDDLTQGYETLRTVEHRLQMIDDAQTHTVPTSDEARARVAALSGASDPAVFENDLLRTLRHVHATCGEFFAPQPTVSDAPLIGPDMSEARLTELGFDRASDALRQIRRWHDGQIAATRSERAREMFVKLEPQIINRLAGAASPDQALAQFDRFLSGLPAGVQVFSLFVSNPQLLDLVVEICAAAPRLARYLGQHAPVIDALVDRDYWSALPDLVTLSGDLGTRLAAEPDNERALDATRRWASEHWFRAGVHVLRGISDQTEAGAAFSRIAEACLSALYPRVVSGFAEKHGPPPGRGMAVLAMGKLGTGEMTSGSDLDLITIYDPGGVETSDGPRPLAPGQYYPRLTQALVAALTAPTAEGSLYEVDMRLRPSGRKGPVAVSLAAFESYQTSEAWVWEHMALTRARVVAGPETLTTEITDIITRVLDARRGQPAVMEEAREMRTRLVGAKAADRGNPWSLKHAAGGLMEIEFLAQTGALFHGAEAGRPARDVLGALPDDWLSAEDATDLRDALSLLQRLQHIERIALETELDPGSIGPELAQLFARAADVESFEALTGRLTTLQNRAAGIVAARFAD